MADLQKASKLKKPVQTDKPKRQKSFRPNRVSALLRSHQRVAVDSLDRLFATAAASALTWAMIAIAIALPLFLFIVLQNLQQH